MTDYVRQSSFSNGDVIDATALNAEYDQLVAAFVAATGHSHDGSAGEGGYVPLISLEDNSTSVRVDATDPTNHKIIFKIDGVDVMTVAEDIGLSADTLAIAVEELDNVGVPVASGYFRWNAAADTVEFLSTIDAADTTGFHTVATSGNLKDTNEIGTPVNNGYFRWDATSATVTYSATIAASDITGLAAVATSGASTDVSHGAQTVAQALDDIQGSVITAIKYVEPHTGGGELTPSGQVNQIQDGDRKSVV